MLHVICNTHNNMYMYPDVCMDAYMYVWMGAVTTLYSDRYPMLKRWFLAGILENQDVRKPRRTGV